MPGRRSAPTATRSSSGAASRGSKAYALGGGSIGVRPDVWANVSDETVRYFLGHYGETAAPVDPEIANRVLSRPQAQKLRDVQPVSLEGARERFGSRISDEELLLRLTMPEEQVESFGQQSPLGRPGQPAELAPVYVLLASDEGSYVSGARIAVTGGTPIL